MPEQVEGGDDGVVYLGKGSFKMKVGVKTTPPAGTLAAKPAAPRATPTPPPVLKTPAPVRRSSGAYARSPAPMVVAAASGGGSATRTMVIGGLCMIAFSCGVISTIAVDRFWPRARAQCVGAPPATTGAAPAVPGIEAASARVVSPVAAAEVAPQPQSDPPPPTPAPASAAPAPRVQPVPPAPTSKTGPAPAVSNPRAVRGGKAVRVPPAQGRGPVRKHAAGAASMSLETMNPTGMWVDPFSE